MNDAPEWLDHAPLLFESRDTPKLEDIPIIRTSDRQLFRRCRRKWHYMSRMQQGLQPKESKSYFWAGSLGHFALEDFHGFNRYGDPLTAIDEAIKAQKLASTSAHSYIPPDWEEQRQIIEGCINYYLEWLEYRKPLETLWIDGKPQVEVRAQIPMIVSGKEVLYDFTTDRVYETFEGSLGLEDYKFMKSFSTHHLDTDTQVSAYCWAASVYYQRPVTEFTYQQHLKTELKLPRVLKNDSVSVNKQQRTSYILYRKGLEMAYGSINAAPQVNKEFLNNLIEIESENRDAFIRRDKIYRNEDHCLSQRDHILIEAEDMLDPQLRIYPNPTRDCGWDCGMIDLCVMMDDGSDWKSFLSSIMEPQPEKRDAWRDKLK